MPGLSAHDRFQTPDVIDPPNTVCLTMTIPDDPIHIANLLGAIYQIAFAPNYPSDAAHTAKALAQVWRRYFSTIQIGDCQGPCPPPLLGGLLEDFEMPLRVDCDCNVFVTCCDGTEKQILTADQVRAVAQGQPGDGTPQAPPGGCMTYQGQLAAGSSWLLPTLLSAGDVVTLESAKGATTDVAPIGRWNCPTGLHFELGACVGTTALDGSALLPSVPIGRLVININGTYYDLSSPVTVPMGVTNAPAAVLVNYAPGGTFGGDLSFTIQKCNNQPAGWNIDQDLTISPGGWTTDIAGTSGTQSAWAAGGWADEPCDNLLGGSGRYNIVFIHRIFSNPTTLTHFDMFFDAVVGDLADAGTQQVAVVVAGVATNIINLTPVTGSNQRLFWDGSIANVSALQILLYGSDHNDITCPPTGSVLLKEVHIEGTGVTPF